MGTNLQQRPPGYELFMAPLQVVLNPTDYERVQFAYFASKYGHAGQTRDGGGRYFDHPKSAAWIYIDELGGRDPHTIIDHLLHDISEDAYLLSPYRISLNFGIDVALDVRALTKLPRGKETTEEYLNRIIARGPKPITTKLDDRLHNLRTMCRRTEEKQSDQTRETRQYHLPMLLPALRAHGELWTVYADELERKMNKVLSQYP